MFYLLILLQFCIKIDSAESIILSIFTLQKFFKGKLILSDILFFSWKRKKKSLQKHFSRLFGPHFGLKIRVGTRAPLLDPQQGTRQVIPGGEVTPLYRLYRYVPPQRVGFCAVSVWKRVYISGVSRGDLPPPPWFFISHRGTKGRKKIYLRPSPHDRNPSPPPPPP